MYKNQNFFSFFMCESLCTKVRSKKNVFNAYLYTFYNDSLDWIRVANWIDVSYVLRHRP